MTRFECDSCGNDIPQGRMNKIEIHVNGAVEGTAELCLGCKNALAEFLRPLPRLAELKR
jgi:hypothetical protein